MAISSKPFFVQLKQGDLLWWKPIELDLKSKIESQIIDSKNNRVEISLKNNSQNKIEGNLVF
jgi:hypothetical protein